MSIGRWLMEDRKAPRPEIAERLHVSVRTLGYWRTHARRGALPRRGRPAHDQAAHRRAFWHVGRAMVKQGFPGSGPVRKACLGVPTRLVQHYVRIFKRQRDDHRRRRIERCRISVEVLARDVIWAQDGWHMGRLPDGRALESQLFKDRGSLRTVCWDVGLAQDQGDLIAQLEAQRLGRGLPLVIASDNLSSCCGRLVQTYLEYHQVIHLLSLPRTPQHNGAAECHIRQLREVTGFRKGMLHEDVLEPASRLLCAVGQLDARPRASKGWKTAVELDDVLPMGYNVVGRDRFYEEARKRMKTAVLGARSWREARMAEREAVYAALECFGLVRRVRGGQPYPRPSGAVFS